MFWEVSFSPFLITILVIFTILSIGAIVTCEKERRKAKAENKVWDLLDYFTSRYIYSILLFILLLGYWIQLFGLMTSGPSNR